MSQNDQNDNDALKTILTFNQENEEVPILNSPRSLLACQKTGIHPKQLIKLTSDQVKEKFKKQKGNLDLETLAMFTVHLEERRQMKIQILIEARNEIIEQEQQGIFVNPIKIDAINPLKSINSLPNFSLDISTYKSTNFGSNEIGMVKNQERLAQKIKNRQQLELQKLIETELKNAEMQKLNALNEQKEKERQQKMEAERENQRQRKQEESRLAQELFQQKLDNDKRIQQQKLQRYMDNERRQKEILEQKQMQEMKEKKLREQRLAQQEYESKQRYMNYQKDFQKMIDNKKKLQDEQDQQRLKKFNEREEKRRAYSLDKAKEKENRIYTSLKQNDEIMKQKFKDFQQRQLEVQEKMDQFHQKKYSYSLQLKDKSEQNQKNIQKVLQQNIEREEQKRQKTLDVFRSIEERNKKLALENQIKNQEKSRQLQEKENFFKGVLHKNQMIDLENRQSIQQRIEMDNLKLERVIKFNKFQLQRKMNVRFLQNLDKEDNIKRIQNIDELKKAEILEKIERDNIKKLFIEQSRMKQIQQSQKVKQQMERQRTELLQKFAQASRSSDKSLVEKNLRSLSQQYLNQSQHQAQSVKNFNEYNLTERSQDNSFHI